MKKKRALFRWEYKWNQCRTAELRRRQWELSERYLNTEAPHLVRGYWTARAWIERSVNKQRAMGYAQEAREMEVAWNLD